MLKFETGSTVAEDAKDVGRKSTTTMLSGGVEDIITYTIRRV